MLFAKKVRISQQLCEKLEEQMHNQDYSDALKTLNRMIRLNPNDPDYYIQIAKIKPYIPNMSPPIDELKKAIEVWKKLNDTGLIQLMNYNHDNIIYAYKTLCFLYLNQKQVLECIERLNELISLLDNYLNQKDKFETYGLAGLAYQRQKEFDKAIGFYIEAHNVALLADQDMSVNWIAAINYNLGVCYTVNEEWDKALAAFDLATILNKAAVNGLIGKGVVDCYRNNLNEAKYNLAQAIHFATLPKEKSQAYLHLGRAYFLDKNYAKAFEHFDKSISISQDHKINNYHLSSAYVNRGTVREIQSIALLEQDGNGAVDLFADALEDYQLASKLEPENYDAYYKLYTAYFTIHEYEKAYQNKVNFYKHCPINRKKYYTELETEFYLNEFLFMNKYLVGEDGGFRKKGKENLSSIIEEAFKKPKVESRAAYLAMSIFKYQVFNDGNTRTAGFILQWILITEQQKCLNRKAYEIYGIMNNLETLFNQEQNEALLKLTKWMIDPVDKKPYLEPVDLINTLNGIINEFQSLKKDLKTFENMENLHAGNSYVPDGKNRIDYMAYSRQDRAKFNKYIKNKYYPKRSLTIDEELLLTEHLAFTESTNNNLNDDIYLPSLHSKNN